VVASAFAFGDVDLALRRLKPDQLLIVEFGADWCAPCNQLAAEVLDTRLAAEVLGRDVGLRVDFESSYGQAMKRRYGVINLPTTVVLHPEGYELGRVEGYPGREDYREAVLDIQVGRRHVSALERAHRQRPHDPAARLDYARALLFAGDTAAARPHLEALIAARATPPALASHAARTLGRWLLRVAEDYPAALVFFE
jgi:thioredoxin-like negative regulator of GroEL